MEWSDYQKDIFEEVADGDDHLVVVARAGSGKTSTIVESLNHLDDRNDVMLCAFNKGIQKELENRAPPNVRVKTLHAIGFGALAKGIGGKFKVDDGKVKAIIKDLSQFEYGPLGTPDGRYKLKRLTALAKNTLAETKDEIEELAYRHDLEDGDNLKADEMAEVVLKILERCAKDTETIDFDDMIWLPHKLECDPYPQDIVFVDEAQDLNAAQFSLVRKMMGKWGRLVAVGDDKQCQPPGTKILIPGGKSVPIEDLENGDAVVAWDRHSQALVGREKPLYRVTVASRPYEGNLYRVSPFAVGSTWCTPNHRWTVRTKRTTNLWCVYLMRQGTRFRVGWCQVFSSNNSFHLFHRTRLEKADAVWILETFNKKRDASLYESLVSSRYGLPLVQFTQSVSSPTAGLLDQNYLDEFWERLGQTGLWQNCLRDHNRDPEFPFYVPPKKGERSSKSTLMEVTASNLIPSFMEVPINLGEKTPSWVGIHDVQTKNYKGKVYSLNVPKYGHYVANGIITHNSIYAWRGAGRDVINSLVDEFEARVLPLSITYRCPKKVVEVANEVVPDFYAAPDAEEGSVSDVCIEQLEAEAKPGDYVLSRTNAPLISVCLSFLKRDIPASLAGRDLAKTLVTLAKRSKTTSAKALRAWLMEHLESERVRLEVEGYDQRYEYVKDKVNCLLVLSEGMSTVDDVIDRIQRIFTNDDDKRVILCSTVHKAKGLERNKVWMLRNTFNPEGGGQEANVYYVGVTRAHRELLFVHT